MRSFFLAVLTALLVAPPAHAAARWTVGYGSVAALRGLDVLRVVPALHVAEVRAAAAPHGRGIRYAERLRVRRETGELGLTTPLGVPPLEWQFDAVHENGVPTWVVRAASTVTIAVIDTGADLSAPDLAAKAPSAYNTHTRTTNVRDANGHGTFVAALAAGSVANRAGMAGFGGDARLLVIKAGSDNGSFTDLDESNAIVYAVDHGARILNLSLGGDSTSKVERAAIDYAASRGALVVAAAGNDTEATGKPEYPAALLQPPGSKGRGGSGLAVAASTRTGRRAPFSNEGSYVSLAAPGDHVLSALSSHSPISDYPRVHIPGADDGLYGFASGTSFAAPEVAGAAALVWAADPLLTAPQVAGILKRTAQGGRWTPQLGFGVIDVAAAVAAASPPALVSAVGDTHPRARA